ncbi:MAG TPA: CopG family transcriptional regulator [Chloroflexota bacterium]|nr:CopG family transcriptional regulator [Chloroflexota bacterium]
MKRTQIYLDEDLDYELRQVASEEGRSAAAVIREATRAYLAEHARELADDPILTMVGIGDGLPHDSAEHHDRDLYGDE